jgi:hypothetical protein
MLRIAECLIYVHADEVPAAVVTDNDTAERLVGWYFSDTGGMFLPEHAFLPAQRDWPYPTDLSRLKGPFKSRDEATARLYRALVESPQPRGYDQSPDDSRRQNADRLDLARWMFDAGLVTRELIRRYR